MKAIRVENLGKQYRIGGTQEPYKTIRETMVQTLKAPVRRLRGGGYGSQTEAFWAVRDLNFEIEQGDVVGIIGRNGAGKSTLLKLLSRITRPTEGVIYLNGRVGSLLEVGTGFHPELTGRENIYLNGAILGMTREEISRKFDEIVDFAEVEKFIDTPSKRYSSGMYLRLAFAVAAHMETEILMVDEVLAVGDADFQKKCLGKMQDVAGAGRTVLFISHSMPAVQNLCNRGIVLEAGQKVFEGEVNEAIQHYMSRSDTTQEKVVDLTQRKQRIGTGEIRLTRFYIENANGKIVDAVASGDECSFIVHYCSKSNSEHRFIRMAIHINTMTGAHLILHHTGLTNEDFSVIPPEGRIRLHMPKIPLTAGRYVVDLDLLTHGGTEYCDYLLNAASFDVQDGDFYGTGRAGFPSHPILLEGSWSLDTENNK